MFTQQLTHYFMTISKLFIISPHLHLALCVKECQIVQLGQQVCFKTSWLFVFLLVRSLLGCSCEKVMICALPASLQLMRARVGVMWRILIITSRIITPPPTVIIMTLLRIPGWTKKFVFVTSTLFVLLHCSVTNNIIKGWTHLNNISRWSCEWHYCGFFNFLVIWRSQTKYAKNVHLWVFRLAWYLMDVKIGI